MHLYPIAPIAWALQSAGHEVRIGTHLHEGFADALTRTGLIPVSLGNPNDPEPIFREDAGMSAMPEEVDAYAKVMGLSPDEREHWICFYQYLILPISMYLRADLPYADDLVEFARKWKPDLVLWDPVFAPGAVAAAASGAVHARFLGSMLDWPGFFHKKLEAHRTQLEAAGLVANPFAEAMRPLAERYGVAVDEQLLFGQWTVDPLPDGIRLPTDQPKLPVRWVPYAFAETSQPWLHERPERPRIALSLGESMRRVVDGDWGRTPKLFEALAELDVEVIATLNSRQLDGVQRIPDNVRVVEWLSLPQVLPTCSLHIHHGGSGTAMPAVASKVPQIVTDTDESIMLRLVTTGATSEAGIMRADHEQDVDESVDSTEESWELPAKHMMAPWWSRYVAKHGAGVRLNYQTMSVEEIRKQILDVLHGQSFRDGANKLHDIWLATPNPNEIVPALERLTVEGRSRI
uniref:nucleotide disphospho-sugar-binding domain-containing protein n=1 Tax=Nocardia suismassiliense TaxID=2077092 RepID=UPI003F493304